MDISKICERIKERRKELNMTQKDLADAMHVSNQLISKWETGESVPSLEYLQQLSEALQTSASALMGESAVPAEEPVEQPAEQAAEPAPAPSKESTSESKIKASQKVKEFWHKNRKALIISIISVAAALVILAVALLSVYMFAPLANKDNYLERIDKGIDKYLERGYYNITRTIEKDGDEDKYPDILQGYIDENGDAVYYNSKTGETVKNKALTYYGGQREYVQPESIKTVTDLLKEQSKTWGDDDDDDAFDLDEFVSYIRKSGSGYYLEFSEDYFFEDFKPSEKKNIRLTEKIKGRVEMDGDITKSIEISVRYRNIVNDEKFSIVSKIEFIQEKPEIEHVNYVKTLAGFCSTKEEFLNKINAVSPFDKADDETLDLIKSKLYNLYSENGYVFVYDDDCVTVLDAQTFAVQKKIEATGTIECATVYNGEVWIVEYSSSACVLSKYNLETGKRKVARWLEGFTNRVNANYAFGGKYFYCSRFESSGDSSIVYNLESGIEYSFDNLSVEYISKSGRIYYKSKGLIYTAKSVDFINTMSTSVLQGTEIAKAENDTVYTRNGSTPTVLYKYEAGVLEGTITLPSNKAEVVGNYYFNVDESVLYDKNGNPAVTFSATALSSDNYKGYEYVSAGKILAGWGDYVVVYYYGDSGYGSHQYMTVYRIGEWDAPFAYTNKIEARRATVENSNLVIYGYLYTNLQDILLFRS